MSGLVAKYDADPALVTKQAEVVKEQFGAGNGFFNPQGTRIDDNKAIQEMKRYNQTSYVKIITEQLLSNAAKLFWLTYFKDRTAATT